MNHIEASQTLANTRRHRNDTPHTLANTRRHRNDTPHTLAMKLGDLEAALSTLAEAALLEEWMHKHYCRNSTDLACTLDELMFWNQP